MKIKRLSLYLISLITALSACTGAGNKVEHRVTGTDYLEQVLEEGETIVNEGDFDPIDLGETTEVPIENGDVNVWTYRDVDPTFGVYLQYDATQTRLQDLKDFITIQTNDEDQENVLYKIEQPSGSEFAGTNDVAVLTATNGFVAGGAYTVSINKTAPLHFYQRNEDIRRVIFTVKDDEHENVDLTLDFPTYPFSNIQSDSGYGVINPCLVYNGTIAEDKGAIIRFTDDPDNKLIDALYCKVVSKNVNSGVTTLYYTSPDVKEIFNECDAHYVDHGLDLENNYRAPTAEEIRQDIVNSEPVLITLMQIANDYGFSDSSGFKDFLKSLRLNVTFKGEGSSLHVLVTLTGIHKFTEGKLDGWNLKACLEFEFHRTYTTSADVKLKKVAGIPVGVSVNYGLSEDSTTSVILKLNLVNRMYDQEVDIDEPPENTSIEEATRMVKCLTGQWNEPGVKETVQTSVDGSQVTIRLGWLQVYLGWITVEIDVYFCITLEISGNLVIGWSRSTHSDLVSYSSSGGGSSDAGNSTSEKVTNTISIALFVKFNFEIFLRLAVFVYITGLKWIFNLELAADIGFYITATGLGEFDWNLTEGKVSGSFGFCIEFGLFFRIILSVNIFDCSIFNMELFNKRWPFVKVDTLEDIKSHVDGTIELTTTETPVGATSLLTFNVFDGFYFLMKTRTFGINEEMIFISSIFAPDVGYKVIKGIVSDNDHVYVEGDKIKVAGDVAETTGNFIVEYTDSILGTTKKCTVPFHYLSKDAHYVTFDGGNKTAKLKGDVIIFPAPEEKAGYVFDGWYLNDVRVDMNSPQIMPDNDINYVSKYKLLKYYAVYYFDGKMNLVYTEMVQEGKPALGPDAATRDQNMGPNFKFVGWDRDLSSITENTKAYGIYIKEGQDNE